MVKVAWQSGDTKQTGIVLGFVGGFDPLDKLNQNPCRTMAIIQTSLGKLVQVYIDTLTVVT